MRRIPEGCRACSYTYARDALAKMAEDGQRISDLMDELIAARAEIILLRTELLRITEEGNHASA